MTNASGQRSFWLALHPSSTLFALRSGLGLLVLAWAVSVAPDLLDLYGPRGVLPVPPPRPGQPDLFGWFPTTRALLAGWACLAASAACLAAGWRVRLAAPLCWLLLCAFHARNPHVLNAGDSLLRILTTYLALYLVFTPGARAGPSLRGWLRGDAFRPEPVWPLRLVQIQLSLIYLASALDKLRGETWRDGSAVYWALRIEELQRFPLPTWLTESAAPVAVLSYGTLLLELALPGLLWWKRTRFAAIALGIALHVGFDYALRIGFFSWAMLLAYLAFVPPASMALALGRLRQRLVPNPGAVSGRPELAGTRSGRSRRAPG
jgi:hypothetical protein